MKIYSNPNVQKMTKAYNKNVAQVKKTEKSQFSPDKIEISETAKDFQTAMKAFDQLPEVREQKIEQLKKEVRTGNYNPTAKEVVNKLADRVALDKKG